ncbi:MAG: DUF2384 domain-containing protein [Acidiferrobacterales bacterium]
MTDIHQKRVAITQAVMSLLEDWKVRATDQIQLLALPDQLKARQLRQYHQGTPFPESELLDARVEHLAGIADALRTTYPRNSQMGTFWLNQKNNRFNNRSPISVMVEDGLDGVQTIRAHLDCAWDWHMDSKKSASCES